MVIPPLRLESHKIDKIDSNALVQGQQPQEEGKPVLEGKNQQFCWQVNRITYISYN
jgi:hypothetical protein